MTTAALTIDWDAVFEEAVEVLTTYVRIDTSNPPGRERAACEFLGGILERGGDRLRAVRPRR